MPPKKSVFGHIAQEVVQRKKVDPNQKFPNIVDFVESEFGLNQPLYPVQRVILKCYYNIPLDDNPYQIDITQPVPKNHPAYEEIADTTYLPTDPDYGMYRLRVPITDFHRKNKRIFTEAGYLRYLYEEGRCNIKEVVPGDLRRELILPIGRRSGKTQMSAIITAYEVARLISLYDPQTYFGLPPAEEILLTTVATGEDQAGILFTKANGYFKLRNFYIPYLANSTMSYARLQTPADVNRYGRYAEDDKAGASVKVTFHPCRAKGLRGSGNILVVLDEEAHFAEEGQSSAEEVYNALAPSQAAFSPKDPRNTSRPIGPVESRMIHISSPLGRQGHFYEMFQLAMRGGSAAKNLLAIQAASWEVNPTLESSELEKEYAKDATVFFTEYGAVFSDQTRGWIEVADDLLGCIDPQARPADRGVPRQECFLGVDVALSGDGSAIAIGHFNETDQIVVDVVDQIRAGEGKYADLMRLDFDQVADWVADYCSRFLIVRGIADQWAGIPFEQALQKRGLRQIESVFFTSAKSSQMYRNLKDFVLDGRIVLYNWPLPEKGQYCSYIQELLELQQRVRSKWIIEVEAPKVAGKHDDQSDALARMVLAASERGSQVGQIAVPRWSGQSVRSSSRYFTGAHTLRDLGKSHLGRGRGVMVSPMLRR